VDPLPVIVLPDGEAVTVHVPVDGSPLNETLDGLEQVASVTVPTIGDDGDTGAALIV
jgi:hypothetical protein